MKQIALRDYLKNEIAWGVEQGKQVRHRLEEDIAVLRPGVIGIDLSRIRLLDVSFSREAIVETMRRFRPDYQFVILHPANEVVVENLEAALDRRGDSAVLRNKDGTVRIIGRQLGPTLRPILETMARLREATSREILAYHEELSIQNCSNKLKELWEAGLLAREELSAKSGGRECVYRALV